MEDKKREQGVENHKGCRELLFHSLFAKKSGKDMDSGRNVEG